MALNKTKWVRLSVAVCFAILQALQPFIHAHLDAEHPIQNTGFHVGSEHEEALSLEHSQFVDSLSMALAMRTAIWFVLDLGEHHVIHI